jgi:hypothetical protein
MCAEQNWSSSASAKNTPRAKLDTLTFLLDFSASRGRTLQLPNSRRLPAQGYIARMTSFCVDLVQIPYLSPVRVCSNQTQAAQQIEPNLRATVLPRNPLQTTRSFITATETGKKSTRQLGTVGQIHTISVELRRILLEAKSPRIGQPNRGSPEFLLEHSVAIQSPVARASIDRGP